MPEINLIGELEINTLNIEGEIFEILVTKWGTIVGDITLQSDLMALIDDINDTINNEITVAIAEEQQARQSADNELQTNLEAEMTMRMDGDLNTQQQLGMEITSRTHMDQYLDDKIGTEAQSRSDQDTILQSNITAEASARQAADTAINTALGRKVDQIIGTTANPKVYSKQSNGSQGSLDAEEYGTTNLTMGFIPRRSSGGAIRGPAAANANDYTNLGQIQGLLSDQQTDIDGKANISGGNTFGDVNTFPGIVSLDVANAIVLGANASGRIIGKNALSTDNLISGSINRTLGYYKITDAVAASQYATDMSAVNAAIAGKVPYDSAEMTESQYLYWQAGRAITRSILQTDVDGLNATLDDLTTQIQALEGAVVYIGTINVSAPTVMQLTARCTEITGALPQQGQTLIDADGVDWMYDATAATWRDIGQNVVSYASETLAGITKLYSSTTGTNIDGAVTQAAINNTVNAMSAAIGTNNSLINGLTDTILDHINNVNIHLTASEKSAIQNILNVTSNVQDQLDAKANASDLNNKVDKMSAGAYIKSYVVYPDGTTSYIYTSEIMQPSWIVRRRSDSHIIVPDNPTSDSFAVNRGFVNSGLDSKIDKNSESDSFIRAYGVDVSGGQVMISAENNGGDGKLVTRNSNSAVTGPDPIADNEMDTLGARNAAIEGKLDIQAPPIGVPNEAVYITNKNGTQSTVFFSQGWGNGYAVKRMPSGHIQAPAGTALDNDNTVTPKKYVDDANNLKLDKNTAISSHSRVYGIDENGTQQLYLLDTSMNGATVALRNVDGTLDAAEPISDQNVATKHYVDENIGGGGQLYQHLIRISSPLMTCTIYSSNPNPFTQPTFLQYLYQRGYTGNVSNGTEKRYPAVVSHSIASGYYWFDGGVASANGTNGTGSVYRINATTGELDAVVYGISASSFTDTVSPV